MALCHFLATLVLPFFRQTLSLEVSYYSYVRSTHSASQFDELSNGTGVVSLFDCLTFSYPTLTGSACGAFKFDMKVGKCSAGIWRPNEIPSGLEIQLYTGEG